MWAVRKRAACDMTDRDWRIFRENHDIIIRSGAAQASHPIRVWEDLRKMLPKAVMDNLQKAGFKKPTAIQMQAIPLGL